MQTRSCLLIIAVILFIGSCSKPAADNSAGSAPTPVTTIPSISITTAISAVTSISAISGGTITADGGVAVTARGVCWNTTANPTIANFKTADGSGTGVFTSNLTGLTGLTTYYVRAYATNSVGTAYGTELSFTTQAPPTLPTLAITAAATNITSTTAISGGNVLTDGGAAVASKGICWSTSSNPTTANPRTISGTGIGIFTSNLSGLTPNTLYYVRAFATNIVGTAYGNEISFTTSPALPICTAVWMDKNLSVTTYQNGDPIPLVTDPAVWSSLTTGAYCYYNNDPATEAVYGKMYNWYAASDPRGLAPAGWHVATNVEWITLRDCLGGMVVAGGKIKETGTTHWSSPNVGATNSSGFTALGGGYRTNFGAYAFIGDYGKWWSPNEFNSTLGLGADVYNFSTELWSSVATSKEEGRYIRCVKN